MSRPRTVVVEVPSDDAMTAVVRAVLRSLADTAPDVRLAASEIDEVAVVLQEACTNAIRHAHGRDASIPVRVEFVRRDDALEIMVSDRGPPFRLPDGAPDPEALCEGGYGIHIIRSWMDEVSVTRTAGGNALRLVRRYRVPAVPREPAVAAGA